MAISYAADTDQQGPSPIGNGEISERVIATGSTGAAGDNNTYTPRFVKNPKRVTGGFTASFSDGVATITANAALSGRAVTFEIQGTV